MRLLFGESRKGSSTASYEEPLITAGWTCLVRVFSCTWMTASDYLILFDGGRGGEGGGGSGAGDHHIYGGDKIKSTPRAAVVGVVETM